MCSLIRSENKGKASIDGKTTLGKVDEMHDRLYNVRNALKSTESRLKEVTADIEQGRNYKQYKGVFEQYNSIQPSLADKLLKRDPKADFYEMNRAEISLFQAAERHLKKHLKAGALPMKAWKSEVETLTAEKNRQYGEYCKLKNDVKEIDEVRRGVDEIVRFDSLDNDRNEQQKKRDRGFER